MSEKTANRLRGWIKAKHIRGPYGIDIGGTIQCDECQCHAIPPDTIKHPSNCSVGMAITEAEALGAQIATLTEERDAADAWADYWQRETSDAWRMIRALHNEVTAEGDES